MNRLGPILLLPLLVALTASAPAASGVERPPAVEPVTAQAGRGVWPLQPRPEVVAGFAPPVSTWGAGHRGVDLLGSPGQAVRTAEDGVVMFAGRIAGRGVVVVGHGPVRTTYEPVEAEVAPGDRVRAGDRIGRLGILGSHCLPRACLHWGLLEGDRYLDPLTLVGAGPVRLLPWLTGSGPGTLHTDAAAAASPGHHLAPAGPVPALPGWRPVGAWPLFGPGQARGWAWR